MERYGDGRFKPDPASRAWLDYVYWLHFAEGSLMPLLVMKLVFGRVATAPMPFFAKPIARKISGRMNSEFLQPRLQDQLALVEDHLARNTWFAGDGLSGADVQMSFPLQAAASRANLDALPHIRDFIQRVEARPAYQRGIERGGPLQLLGA